MGKLDALIAEYAGFLGTCGLDVDRELLEKVTTGCGPAIWTPEGRTIRRDDAAEIEAVREHFLVRKLGLADGPDLDEAIAALIEICGVEAVPRAVLYYLLVRHFGAEDHYP